MMSFQKAFSRLDSLSYVSSFKHACDTVSFPFLVAARGCLAVAQTKVGAAACPRRLIKTSTTEVATTEDPLTINTWEAIAQEATQTSTATTIGALATGDPRATTKRPRKSCFFDHIGPR